MSFNRRSPEFSYTAQPTAKLSKVRKAKPSKGLGTPRHPDSVQIRGADFHGSKPVRTALAQYKVRAPYKFRPRFL